MALDAKIAVTLEEDTSYNCWGNMGLCQGSKILFLHLKPRLVKYVL